jgi:hypothetical protein
MTATKIDPKKIYISDVTLRDGMHPAAINTRWSMCARSRAR